MIRKPENDNDREFLRRLLARQIKTRREIDQYLTDVGAWNRSRPIEDRLDPDPDGEMLRAARYLDRTIAEIRAALDAEATP